MTWKTSLCDMKNVATRQKLPLILLLLTFSYLLLFFAALAGNHYVFDEMYYVPSAIDTLHGAASNIEHPPLAKALFACSIFVFGDNWLGWRLISIISAIVAVCSVYLIAKHFLNTKIALFSAALTCLSVIFTLIGSTAMLDMPCLMFSLLGLLLVLKNRFALGGLMFGLSFLCKELAVLMFLTAALYLFYKKVAWRKLAVLGLVAVIVGVGGVWLYDLTFQPVAGDIAITNPVEHFRLMVVWQLNLNGVRAPNLMQWYPPIGWVSPFGANALNPLSWLWGADADGNLLFSFRAASSPLVEYLMFPLLLGLPYFMFKRCSDVAVLSWLWLCAVFLPWLLAGFVVLMEGNFYVVYSVPFLAVGCGYLYSLIKRERLRVCLMLSHLGLGVVFFLWYFPLMC